MASGSTSGPDRPPIVIMGVAGAGKTSVGGAIAERLGSTFIDGDHFHSAASRDRMAAGVPIDDSDRLGWLDAVGEAVQEQRKEGRRVVLACSALSKAHRERLKRWIPDAKFFWLDVPVGLLQERLAMRRGHFAGPALLSSQLTTLEPPRGTATRIDASAPIETVVEAVLKQI